MATLQSPGPPHLVQCDIARTWLSAAVDPNRPTSPRLGATGAQTGPQATLHSANGPSAPQKGAQSPPSNVYLGETYTAQVTLSVPAEAAPHTAHKVHLVVEIHSGIPPLVNPTAPSSSQPPPPPPSQIRQHSITKRDYDQVEPGHAVQVPIEWELKELASHAVVCFVSYGVQVQDRETGELTLVTRQLRKILRFEVLNPLSVRTKAHAPTSLSPTTYLSPTERCKVFLEVQVQNHCDSPMSFSRMRFDPLPGFTVSDEPNRGFLVDADSSAPSLGGKGDDLLHLSTGSVRQFLYILTITDPALLGSALPAGSSQGLGRLDIVWHTARGQKGHLQSATLGRRIPPAPAHFAHGPGATAATSRQIGTSPALPPLAPASPAHGSRPSPSPQRGFDHSSTPSAAATAAASSSTPRTSISSTSAAQAAGLVSPAVNTLEGFKVDVTVSEVLPAGSACQVGETVTVRLRVVVQRPRRARSADPPPTVAEEKGSPSPQRPRRVRLVAQHVQWHPSPTLRQASDAPLQDATAFMPFDTGRKARSTEMAIPGAMPPLGAPPFAQQQQPSVTSLELQQRQAAFLAGHRRETSFDRAADLAGEACLGRGQQWREAPRMHGFELPRPFPGTGPPGVATANGGPSAAVLRLGTDTTDLGLVDIPGGGEGAVAAGPEGEASAPAISFELRFVPLERGLTRFGGLRVLALPEDEAVAASPAEGQGGESAEDVGDRRDLPSAISVCEAATIAEVWCE